MSTDYGLCCACGEFWFTDNLGESEVETILHDLPELAKLSEALKAIRLDIYLSTHFSSANDLDGLLDFAEGHHTHKMNVINEYLFIELLTEIEINRKALN